MERKTLDIFASTSNYMKYLIEEIITSNVEIPTETVITINDLMVKLFSFMNYLYKNESKAGKSMVGGQYLGRNDNNLLPNSFPPNESLPTCSSQAGYIDSSQSSKFNHVSPQTKSNTKSEPILKPAAFSSQTSQVVKGSKANDPVAPSTKQVPKKIVVSLQPNSALSKSEPVTPAKPTVKKTATKSDTPAGDSKSLIAIKMDSAASKTIPSDVFITKLFCSFTDNILLGYVNNQNMGVYCRVCDLLCQKSWSHHITELTHVEKSQHLKKLRMYTCRLCKMCIYGSANLIKKYFEYHYHKIHEAARTSCEESMEQVQCETTKNNGSTSSSISSLNKAIDDFPAKAKAKKKKKKKTTDSNEVLVVGNETAQAIGTASSTDSTSQRSKNELLCSPLSASRGSEMSDSLDKTAPNNPNSLNKTAPSKPIPHITSPYPNFDKIIAVMSKNWSKNCLRVDAGYCTICQLGIESGFEWFSHVDDHGSKDLSVREEICPLCNVKIYGSEHKKYLNLPSHIELDKLFFGHKAAK